MIKNKKYLIIVLIIYLFTGCSFDSKTGIWSGDEKEKQKIAELEKEQNQKINVEKAYSSENIYLREITAVKKVILNQPTKNLDWKMSGLNLQNFMGNSYLSSTSNNFLKKKIGKNKFSNSKVMASPIVINNNILLTDDTGTIFYISRSGELHWKKNIYKKINKKISKNLSLSVYKNKIYIADNIGFIYSIDLNTSKLIWIKNHGIPIKSKIKVFDNKIFVINQDNRIICFETEKGSKIWDVRSVSSFIKSQGYLALAITKEGDLLTINSSGDLTKFEINYGRIYWSLNVTSSLFAHDKDFFESSDVVLDDDKIIFSTISSIFSYDLTNGYLNWKVDLNSTNTPIIVKDNIFLVSNSGYFINLNRSSGEIVWSTNILKILKRKKQKTEVTGFILGSGKVYATTLNGYLIVCSASSGKVESFKKIGNSIVADPIISDGSLYILTENSKLFGFN